MIIIVGVEQKGLSKDSVLTHATKNSMSCVWLMVTCTNVSFTCLAHIHRRYVCLNTRLGLCWSYDAQPCCNLRQFQDITLRFLSGRNSSNGPV